MSEKKRTVAAGEFKQTCLRLIVEVRTSGIGIVITKRGKPIAQVVPLEPEEGRHEWPTDLAQEGVMKDSLIEPAELPKAWEALRE